MSKKHIRFHYVYVTTNKINGHNYVGQRTCYNNELPETDNYLGSGKILNEYAIPKYGRENFCKEVLAICNTKQESDILEKHFIAYYKSFGKAEYNISDGGNGGNLGKKVNNKISDTMQKIHLSERGEEIRQKIREARKHQNPMATKEAKEKRKESIRKYWESEEGQRQKKINSERSKSLKPPTKGKHWYNNGVIEVVAFECPDGFVKGQLPNKRIVSEETKQKLRDIWKNRTEEQRKELSEKFSKIHTGRHFTEEQKKHIGDGNRGRHYFNNGEIEVMQFECPPGFVPGRCPKAKAAISNGMNK